MFALNDSQKMMQKVFRDYAENEIAPHVEALEKGEMSPFELTRKMMEHFGILQSRSKAPEKPAQDKENTGKDPSPSESGNKGAGEANDPMVMNILIKELCRVAPGLALSFGASLGLAGGAINAKGTDRQIREFAAPIMAQEKIGSWALTEPGAGSDALGAMESTAIPDGNDHYILNGTKTFITNAPIADIFVVYVKIDRGESIKARPVHSFILERGMKGFSTGEPFQKLGMRDSPTSEVFMENVRVEKNRLLGEVENREGRESTKESLGNERSGMQGFAWGIIERCFDECVILMRQRQQAGIASIDEQPTMMKLYRIYMHLKHVENIIIRTAWMRRNDIRDAAFINASKAYTSEAATEVVNDAMDMFREHGYQGGHPVEKLFRDAKLLELGAGTTVINVFSAMQEIINRKL